CSTPARTPAVVTVTVALIDPGPEIGRQEGRILCRPRLGGLLRHYYREAA
ncbi:MAG: hypothetical protein JKY65_20125, partial [Planctomycetes bacterium]|nr:hypothetical protein [Planctomycetota bacterium]